MIRKMRIGQIQMGAFTTVGLETITKEMSALWIPLLFQNYDELDYVRGKLDAAPREGAGRQGLRRPQLGRRRLGEVLREEAHARRSRRCRTRSCSRGPATPESEEMYSERGLQDRAARPDRYSDEPADQHDRGVSGAGHRGARQPVVRPRQEHDGHQVRAGRRAPRIITKAAWDKIDPSLRPTLLKLARETGTKFTPQIRKLETDAIDAMVKRGLQVQTLTPQAEQEWQQMADKFYPKIRGTIVPADLFDEVRRLVDGVPRAEAGAGEGVRPSSRSRPGDLTTPVDGRAAAHGAAPGVSCRRLFHGFENSDRHHRRPRDGRPADCRDRRPPLPGPGRARVRSRGCRT